jgi:hypothetical protein
VHNGAVTLDPGAVRHGRVRGRYFRENFAQGGIDLVQIVPELVTNADAAIAASGRQRGRIELAFAPPDRDWLAHWRAVLRRLRVPAMLSWRHEIVCTDDGEGMNAELVDLRLGALGERPIDDRQRGLFGRGLRDVWLAQGGGRIEGARAGRLVESWFFPAAGDEPYAYVHVRDEPASGPARAALGLDGSGTRVTVPLAARRLPPSGRLRTLVAQLVQLRPVLEDPERELWLALPGEPLGIVTYPRPEPDPERPVLFEGEVEVASDVTARIVVAAPRSRSRSGPPAQRGAAGWWCAPAGRRTRPRSPAIRAGPAPAICTESRAAAVRAARRTRRKRAARGRRRPAPGGRAPPPACRRCGRPACRRPRPGTQVQSELVRRLGQRAEDLLPGLRRRVGHPGSVGWQDAVEGDLDRVPHSQSGHPEASNTCTTA